jgi:hypothetical protein
MGSNIVRIELWRETIDLPFSTFLGSGIPEAIVQSRWLAGPELDLAADISGDHITIHSFPSPSMSAPLTFLPQDRDRA